MIPHQALKNDFDEERTGRREAALKRLHEIFDGFHPAGLNAIGNNLLKETEASGSPITGNPQSTGFGSVVQGSLEQSNVDIVSEITDLITAQRAFEANSKIITTSNEVLQTVVNMKQS